MRVDAQQHLTPKRAQQRPNPCDLTSQVRRHRAQDPIDHRGGDARTARSVGGLAQTFCDYLVLLCEDMPGLKTVSPPDALILEIWAIYRAMTTIDLSSARN